MPQDDLHYLERKEKVKRLDKIRKGARIYRLMKNIYTDEDSADEIIRIQMKTQILVFVTKCLSDNICKEYI